MLSPRLQNRRKTAPCGAIKATNAFNDIQPPFDEGLAHKRLVGFVRVKVHPLETAGQSFAAFSDEAEQP
jgi:hypothetical protein